MLITHKLPKLKVERDCESNSFTLANGLGSFVFLSDPPISKYNGLIINFELDTYKILENIGIKDNDYTQLIKQALSIQRKGKFSDKIFMPQDIQGLVYQTSSKAPIILDFDIKKPYDGRNYGRYYKVSVDNKNIIIKFTKMTDEKEDSLHMSKEYELFVVIQPKSCNLKKDYTFIDKWEEHHYPYDQEREDMPYSRFVYRPFIVNAKGALITVGRSKEEALDELAKLSRYKHPKAHPCTIKNKNIPKEEHAAFMSAQASLANLEVRFRKIKRLFAGFPWFFQIWTRDESISSIGLMKISELKEAKDILMSYLHHIDLDGRIPNRMPSSSLGCADGVGWVFKRIKDLMEIAEQKEIYHELFTPGTLDLIQKMLRTSIKRISEQYERESLIYSRPKETWMDTYWNHQDGREGFCIEIQCQYLNMLDMAHNLTKEPKFKNKLELMRALIKVDFFNGKLLADNKDDYTVRPNIFIAYYHYPKLLSRVEWEKIFQNSLDRLWLDWGGLSSIDKHHHLFTDMHTGSGDRSYHRGDSWYWVNNLAALCLFQNNAIKFDKYIKKIISSSTEEILWHGSIGDHAEVSDARQLSSKGCLSQAWSSALFIQLISEVYER